MRDWKDLRKELLKNSEFKKEYEKMQPRYEATVALIEARLKTGLTQKALAKKIKTKQSAIARLESGNANPSIGFLQKLAEALGKKLVIRFE